MQIFDSYIDAGQKLNKREREQYYTALIEYLAYGVEPNVKGAALAVVTAIRPSLDESRQRIVNGRKGGRPRKNLNDEMAETKTQENGKAKPEKPEKLNAENEESQTAKIEKTNSNSKGNSKDSPKGESKRTPFIPPTPQEVDAYIAEKGYTGFDGEQFCAFYESNGWKVGRNPMKSWKGCVVTWAKRHKSEGGDDVDYGDWAF